MKNLERITYLQEISRRDENGEIKEQQLEKTIYLRKEDDYIKIYLQHINYLNNLPEGLDNIIYQLLKRINYQNQIIINSAIKRQIAEELGKKFNTINQYISKLVRYGILIRIDTGIYYMNPVLFGKGSWKDILELRKKLEITIEYKEGEYTIKHKFNN